MKKLKLIKKIKQSFTIIELSVVLLILSILMSGTIVVLKQILNKTMEEKNKQKIELIQKSLQNYFNIYRRLPRPAKYDFYRNLKDYGTESIEPNALSMDTDYYTNSFQYNFAKNINEEKIYKANVETTIYYGIIPFKELKLTESDIIDAYGNYMEYYVPQMLTLKENEILLKKNSDSRGEIVKKDFFKKTQKDGKYDEYFCPAKHNQTPDELCDKSNDVTYGINFKQQKLPKNYVQLNYIQSSGEQQIDTRVIPDNSKLEIIFKIQPTNFIKNEAHEAHNYFYGTQSNKLSFLYSNTDTNNGIAYWNTGDTSNLAIHSHMYLNKDYEYDVTYNSGTMTIKGSINTDVKYTGDLPNETIYFFSNGNNQINPSIKLFNLKIYQNNELIRDYIPCYELNEDSAGLYDLINDVFYKDKISTSFIKGPKVEPDTINYIIPSYGLRIKDVETDNFIDKNGTIAYVIVSHGKNGNSTCSIQKPSQINKKPNIISKLNSSTANIQTRNEAQNCISIEKNASLDIVGREEFLSSKNKEIMFYSGIKNANFDDDIAYKTLDQLITERNNN